MCAFLGFTHRNKRSFLRTTSALHELHISTDSCCSDGVPVTLPAQYIAPHHPHCCFWRSGAWRGWAAMALDGLERRGGKAETHATAWPLVGGGYLRESPVSCLVGRGCPRPRRDALCVFTYSKIASTKYSQPSMAPPWLSSGAAPGVRQPLPCPRGVRK